MSKQKQLEEQIDLSFRSISAPPKKEMLEMLSQNRQEFKNMCKNILCNDLINLENPFVLREIELFLTKMEEAKDCAGRALWYSQLGKEQ